MKAVCRTSTNCKDGNDGFQAVVPPWWSQTHGCHHSNPMNLSIQQGGAMPPAAVVTDESINSDCCGDPILLQNWSREQWNRRGVGTLIGDAGWSARTARCGRPPERVLIDLGGSWAGRGPTRTDLFSRVQDGNGMTVLAPSGDVIVGPLSDSKAHAFGGG